MIDNLYEKSGMELQDTQKRETILNWPNFNY